MPLFVEYGGKSGKLPQVAVLKVRTVFFHIPGDYFADSGEGTAIDEFFDNLSKAAPSAIFGVMDKFDIFKKNLDESLESCLFHGPHWSLADEPNQENQPESRFYGNVSARALSSIVNVAKAGKVDDASRGSTAITLGKEPCTFEVKGKVDRVWTKNIVGLLEGSDPKLKTEYIIVCGYLDHFGIQRGKVYPGADDDGSEVTGVIEIARMMFANSDRARAPIRTDLQINEIACPGRDI